MRWAEGESLSIARQIEEENKYMRHLEEDGNYTRQDVEDNFTQQDGEDNFTQQDGEDNSMRQDGEDNYTRQDGGEKNLTRQDGIEKNLTRQDGTEKNLTRQDENVDFSSGNDDLKVPEGKSVIKGTRHSSSLQADVMEPEIKEELDDKDELKLELSDDLVDLNDTIESVVEAQDMERKTTEPRKQTEPVKPVEPEKKAERREKRRSAVLQTSPGENIYKKVYNNARRTSRDTKEEKQTPPRKGHFFDLICDIPGILLGNPT